MCIRSKRFMVNDPAQSNVAQRPHAQQCRIARVGHARNACPYGFTRTPGCGNTNVIGRHAFESRDGQLSQPREKILFLVFEITAECREFEVCMCIYEAGKNYRLAERFEPSTRKS